jgi:hypothetical protein
LSLFTIASEPRISRLPYVSLEAKDEAVVRSEHPAVDGSEVAPDITRLRVAGCAGRDLNLAAIVAALAHRGSVGDSSTLQSRADAIHDVRKADPNLSVDQSAAATNAPKNIVEALLNRVK